MHVAVMGAGSLGSLVGGLLADQHRVTLVGRAAHMRAVAADGLEITGLVERRVHPAATTDWGAVDDADLALITVKSYDTQGVARSIGTAPPPVVVTLQNGLGIVERLRDTLPPQCNVLAGTVTYGARLESPGEVRCTGLGDIALGDPGGGRDSAAERIAAGFTAAGIECEAAIDMPRRRWEKLAINAAINPVTALARVRNGAIREQPLRPIALAAAREVGSVATTRGIDVDPATATEAVLDVAARTRENESSMARDVRRGRRTEVDAITGAVIERAVDEAIPVNRVLYGLVVGYEVGAGRRESV